MALEGLIILFFAELWPLDQWVGHIEAGKRMIQPTSFTISTINAKD